MTDYTPTKIPYGDGLDETGTNFSLERLPNEELNDYRDRLFSESRDRGGPTEADFVRTTGRQVGQRDVYLFELDLATDAAGALLAADPYLEVTSTRLRYYRDYSSGAADIDIDFQDYSGGAFLSALEAFTSESTLTVDYLPGEDITDFRAHGELLTRNLRFGNTTSASGSILLMNNCQSILPHKYLKTIRFSDLNAFENEKSSVAEVVGEGDYYVDYVNGVVYSHELAVGYCSYEYRAFPFKLIWQPVRAYPYNDADLKYRHKNTLIDDDGTSQNLLLNAEGAKVANTVLNIHPLGWGE